MNQEDIKKKLDEAKDSAQNALSGIKVRLKDMDKEKAKEALSGAKEKAKVALAEIKANFKADEGAEGVKKYQSMFKNLWKSGTTGKATLVAASFVVLLLFKSIFLGGGTSDVGEGFEDSTSEDVDTLVMKGLYMRQPGDDALTACKKIVSSAKDLVAVDFRKGIEREKDEATKAADKKKWGELVKQAETDVDLFLKWNSINGHVYNPSVEACEGNLPDPNAGELFHKPAFNPRLEWSGDRSVTVPGPNYTLATAMASLAAVCGYQIEWMLPGKSKKVVAKPQKLLQNKFVVPVGCNDNAMTYWREKVEGAPQTINELCAKGLKCSMNEDRTRQVFFRLKLQDGEGKGVSKSTVAKELLLFKSFLFRDAKSREEELSQAEREVDNLCRWVETDGEHRDEISHVGSQIKSRRQKELELDALAKKTKKQCLELDKKWEKLDGEYCDRINKIKRNKALKVSEIDKEVSRLEVEKQKVMAENRYQKSTLEQQLSKKSMDSQRRVASNGKLPDPQYFETMAEMSRRCKIVIEWAVFVEPVDELVETKKTIVIPEKNQEGACKFVHQLDINLGKDSESIHGSDHSRKRILFEKDLIDVGSPLWFRLVLKNTNGVEVAKGDVVKNWLAARGHYPPGDKEIIAKKNLIEIAIREDGKREDELKGLCFVWIDGEDKVKEVYFNEKGMARIFNAGDLSIREFAQELLSNYAGDIPSFEEDATTDATNLLASMKTYTWIYKDPRGYQVKLLERAFYDITGKKIDLRPDMALQLAVKADKTCDKFFAVSAIKPESARKFD